MITTMLLYYQKGDYTIKYQEAEKVNQHGGMLKILIAFSLFFVMVSAVYAFHTGTGMFFRGSKVLGAAVVVGTNTTLGGAPDYNIKNMSSSVKSINSTSSNVTLSVVIKNIGDSTKKYSTTEFTLQGYFPKNVLTLPLATGQTATISVTYAASKGKTYLATATVDKKNDIRESNERNNKAQMYVNVF